MSGGGTGGHIYPAIAIIDEIKRQVPEVQILYIGTPNSMEERVAKEQGLDFQSIRVVGLPRKLSLKMFRTAKELMVGLAQARRVILDFDPDLVIGTGGFVSGPVLFIAALHRKKSMIHEQNSLPGLTNRILSRFVDRVATTYESSKRYFKRPDRVFVTGNPIRASLGEVDRAKSYEIYGFTDQKPTVFSFGGSNGSESLNEAILQMLQSHGEDLAFQLIHGTGRGHYEGFMAGLKDRPLPNGVKIAPYLTDIGSAYAVSDLVIASSGAITLAEISSLGVASILIPKAYTTENHQEFNARLYVEMGASDMLLEDDLTGELLYNRINAIVTDENVLKTMGENAKTLGNPNATEDIVRLAMELL